MQSALRIFFTVLVTFSLLTSTVFAANSSECPSGMSDLDCEAILGNWPNWIPDDGGVACGGDGTTVTSDASLPGGDNKQKAFNYFRNKGLTDSQAAAIVGNLIAESSVSTSADQPDGPGLGIAQWSNPGRWKNGDPTDTSTLVGFANSEGSSDYYSLGVQLDFMWHELSDEDPYKEALTNLKTKTTIEDQTAYFMGTAEAGLHAGNTVDSVTQSYLDKYGRIVGYENPGTPHLDRRIEAAQLTLRSFGSSSSGAVSGSDASCGSIGAINCDSTTNGTDDSAGTGSAGTALSTVRQNVVCLAERELALWTTGQMKPGHDFFKYSQNDDQLWCADFASWIYNEAGYPIGKSPAWRVASVDGIHTIGSQNENFHYHDADGSYTPKPGDLLIHQTSSESHVNIIVSVNSSPTSKSMTIIGGDQPPTTSAGYPDGSVVSQYTDNSFSGTDNITGFVSPE